MISIFLVGTVIAALAPNMPVLVAARAAQGYGAAAQFTISQGTIARAYPPGARIRVLSLMSATWVLPGLLGPSLGAVITTLLGWRWAFGAILVPAIVAAAITYPRLRAVAASGVPTSRPAIRVPFQLALGAGLFIGALSAQSWWSWPLVAVGLAVALEALRFSVPPGSMRAAPGLPAIVAASFFLSFAFYAASSFVPLVLVGVRSVSVIGAGVALAASTLAWTLGVSLNTALVDRYPRARLIAGSAALLAAGTIGFATAIYGAPLLIAFVAWPVAGLGMGICFNTLTLNAMAAARVGGEGVALGARNLTGSLGTAVGTGVGGAAVAAGQAAHVGLSPGLAATYALAAAAALTTGALAWRTTPTSR
jgi:predicted MFS family arabinose efflux permease